MLTSQRKIGFLERKLRADLSFLLNKVIENEMCMSVDGVPNVNII